MQYATSAIRLALVLLSVAVLASTAVVAEQVESVTLCERTGGNLDDDRGEVCDAADIRFQGRRFCEGNPGQSCNFDGDCGGDGPCVDPTLGFSMAMGYLNGDNFADLVVGAPGEAKVYVYYGTVDKNQDDGDLDDPLILDPSALSAEGAADIIFTGPAGSQFGFSVSIASQFNPFSNPLIIGAPGTDTDTTGAAYVVPAVFFVLASTPALIDIEDTGAIDVVKIIGEEAGDEAGYSVALGPVLPILVDGDDDDDDFVVAARTAEDDDLRQDQGIVYVIEATTAPAVIDLAAPGVTVRKIIGAEEMEGLGEYLAVADFRGGFEHEIAIGAVGTEPGIIAGHVYMVGTLIGDEDLGDADTPRIEGDTVDDFLGFSLAAGDFDDDLGMDLAIGAIYADRTTDDCATDEINSGAVYVFDNAEIDAVFGGMSAVPASDATRAFWGYRRWDELGFSLGVGDVNGDGDDDLVATARRYDRDQT